MRNIEPSQALFEARTRDRISRQQAMQRAYEGRWDCQLGMIVTGSVTIELVIVAMAGRTKLLWVALLPALLFIWAFIRLCYWQAYSKALGDSSSMPEILTCPRTPYVGRGGIALLVLGARDIAQWTSDAPHVIISIQDSGADDWPLRQGPACRDVLRLNFDDIKGDMPGYLPCLRGHGRQIAEFVTKHRPHVELIVCQCAAGVSRSAGVAAALSEWLNGEDRWFHKHYVPNWLVQKRVGEWLK